MAKNDNLKDFLTDLADAIREKKGTSDPINPQDFASEIASIVTDGGGDTPTPTPTPTPSTSKWTGHADVEGLRAIGWTDEDIAYYQENGVNWNAEDDKYHKVTDDNKALYGVLTADNISTYKDRIVYLPKIDTSERTSMSGIFQTCYVLVSIPLLDTSNVTDFSSMFKNCYSLISIPQLDTSKATTLNSMFYGCRSIIHIPLLDTSSAVNTASLFYGCFSLTCIPPLDLSLVTNADAMFYNCYSVVDVPHLNMGHTDSSDYYSMNNIFYNCNSITKVSVDYKRGKTVTNPFYNCYALSTVLISNYNGSWQLTSSPLLSKESLLYIINNLSVNTVGTSSIKLHSYAYDRLVNDADVVEALEAQPRISISK